MAKDVIMPVLGMNQDTGLLVAWRKQPGDTVEKGEPLMDVETDKAVMEIEAPAAGILTDVRAAEGEEVPVGNVIAMIATDADEAANLQVRTPAPAADAVPATIEDTPPEAAPAATTETQPARSVQPTATDSGSSQPRPPASPLAKRTASERGVDLSSLHGSGPHGAVLMRDVPTEPVAPARASSATAVYGELESYVESAAFWTVLRHAEPSDESRHAFFIATMVRFLAASLRKRIERDPDEGVHIETRGPDGSGYIAHADQRGIGELAGLVQEAAIEPSSEHMTVHATVVHAGDAPIDAIRAPELHAPIVLGIGRLRTSGEDGAAAFTLNLRHNATNVDHTIAIGIARDLVHLVEDPASLAVAF